MLTSMFIFGILFEAPFVKLSLTATSRCSDVIEGCNGRCLCRLHHLELPELLLSVTNFSSFLQAGDFLFCYQAAESCFYLTIIYPCTDLICPLCAVRMLSLATFSTCTYPWLVNVNLQSECQCKPSIISSR